MLERFSPPTKPGLFVTGTDTGVGKTVIACAIAAALRRQRGGARIAVCKPFATGCRRERGALVNDDAEALAHFADCRMPLDVINPVRFRDPLAPAVAAERAGAAVPWGDLHTALRLLDAYGDAMVVEGVGGVMVPLDRADPCYTVLDFAARLGLPAVVIARSGLGTLSHTAMTVKLLREAGVRVAGVVMNHYVADEAAAMADDPSVADNRAWIGRMTRLPVLATVPHIDAGGAGPAGGVRPGAGEIPASILDTVALVDWWGVVRRPATR